MSQNPRLLPAIVILVLCASTLAATSGPDLSNTTNNRTAEQLLAEVDDLAANFISLEFSTAEDSEYQQVKKRLRAIAELALQRAESEKCFDCLIQIARLGSLGDQSTAIAAARVAVKQAASPSQERYARFELAKSLHRSVWWLNEENDTEVATLEEAKNLSQSLVASHGSDPEVLKLHAEILNSTDGPNEAYGVHQQALQAAREANLTPDPYLRTLFLMAADLGKNDEALKWFEEIEDLGFYPDLMHQSYAKVLENEGKFDQAARAHLIVAQGGPWPAWCDAGRNFYLADEYDSALSALRTCIDQSMIEQDYEAQIPAAHLVMSVILNERGVYEESIKHAEIAIDLVPNQPNPYYVLSQSLQVLGRYDEAIDAVKEAIRLSDGRYAAMHFQLGSIYFDQSSWRLARVSFEKAAELDVVGTAAPYNVALCFSREGYYRDAAEWYQKVLARDPRHPERESILERIRLLRD